MIELVSLAREIQEYLEEHRWRFCFIGGLSVQRWGEPRLTRDLDLSVLTGFGREADFVEPLLARFDARIVNAAEFARQHRVVLLRSSAGIGIDVALAALPFEERMMERATLFEFAPGVSLRTCSAEDLIVLKLFASRPLDLHDARTIAIRQAGRLDWDYVTEQLTPLAEIKGEPGILSTLREIRASEERPLE